MIPKYTANSGATNVDLAVYICDNCGGEWYVGRTHSNPEMCPFCGEVENNE